MIEWNKNENKNYYKTKLKQTFKRYKLSANTLWKLHDSSLFTHSIKTACRLSGCQFLFYSRMKARLLFRVSNCCKYTYCLGPIVRLTVYTN